MKNTIIGTAGHVDHGKTQLIKALTGIDTDRLQEEKKRGITIDLGFASLTLPDGDRVGIVDVPGHERFIKNMLAGAGGINLALLVVAADDGVMPQTREHLDILSLLDIGEGIIVITKADLVEPEWIDIVADDIRAAVAKTFLKDAPILAVSAHTGQGIDALRDLIAQRVQSAANRNLSRPYRIPVDRVFTVEGFGTVITGTLIEGALSEGDEVVIYPTGLSSRVRNLQVHGQDVETAYAGQRVAVNLAGIRREEVARGDTLALPGSMESTQRLDIKLRVLPGSRRTLQSTSRLHFYHGAHESLCRLSLLGTDALGPGQEAYAQLYFAEPVAVKKGDRFVLRFYSPLETVGGGVVLDPNPQKHRRNDSGVLDALSVRETGTDTENVLQALLDASPRFGQLADIQRQLSMDADAFRQQVQTLVADGRAVQLSGKTVIAADFKESLGRRLVKILRDYHAANPLQAGMRRDALRGQLMPGREISLADKVLALYEQDGLIAARGPRIALSGFEIRYTEREEALAGQIMAALTASEYMPPSLEELYAIAPREKDALKRVLDAMLDTGALVITSPQIVFRAETVERAWGLLSSFAEANGQVTLAEFRDMIGASRKFALSLLEYFDRQNRTRMQGDARVLVKKPSS